MTYYKSVFKNGVETVLNAPGYRIETHNGWNAMPDLRGASPQVPGRSGVLFQPGRARSTGVVYLRITVEEKNDSGLVPNGTMRGYQENLDLMFRLFDTSISTIILREYMTDLASPSFSGIPFRECECEVPGSFLPTLRGRHWGDMTVECRIVDTYWRGDTTITDSISSNTTGAVNRSFTPSLATLSSAPIENATLKITGPITNPRVTDVTSGHYIQFNLTLAAGQILIVDCWNYTATVSGVSQTHLVTRVGPYLPRYFVLTPRSVVMFTGSGGTTATKLEILGKARYL